MSDEWFLRSTQDLWPDEKEGPFVLKCWFATVDGRPTLVGIEMWGRTPPTVEERTRWDLKPRRLEQTTPVTSSALRLPIGRLVARARDRAVKVNRAVQENRAGVFSERAVTSARHDLDVWASRSAGRRPMYGEDHWRKVADTYEEAWRVGDHPTRAVEAAFIVSKSTAAKWVARCRSLGLLPATSRGVAQGGRPA